MNVGGLLGGGWHYSGRVHLSGYESQSGQPVNRFRFDVRSGWLNLAAGDVNPVLQDLVLAGTRVRGVQGSIRGGPFYLSVVRGQTRRAVKGLIDPLNPTRIEHQGTYGRDLFAVRPAFGGETFQVGITAMRVKDDVGSIENLRVDAVDGTTRRVNPAPKDNVVAGADASLRLLGGRVLLRYDGAISLLANDISRGPFTKEQLDSILADAGAKSLDIDPADFEDIFTLNASLIPLDPRGFTSLAQQASASGATSWRPNGARSGARTTRSPSRP